MEMRGRLNAPTDLFSVNPIPNKGAGWAPRSVWMAWEWEKHIALAEYRQWLCAIRS